MGNDLDLMIDRIENITAKSQINSPAPQTGVDTILPKLGKTNHDAVYSARPPIASIAVVLCPKESTVPPMTNRIVTSGDSGANTYATNDSPENNIATKMVRLIVSPRLRIQFGMNIVVIWLV